MLAMVFLCLFVGLLIDQPGALCIYSTTFCIRAAMFHMRVPLGLGHAAVVRVACNDAASAVRRALNLTTSEIDALLARRTSKISFSSFRDSRLISSSSASAMLLLLFLNCWGSLVLA
jgi:hypothetical protein